MLIKLENDEVTIKGRGCEHGINQRNWLSKEDTLLPTMSTEGLIISCIIDALEGQDVATSDTPVAFLKTGYEKIYTHINMDG